jgi:hypothetical protein
MEYVVMIQADTPLLEVLGSEVVQDSRSIMSFCETVDLHPGYALKIWGRMPVEWDKRKEGPRMDVDDPEPICFCARVHCGDAASELIFPCKRALGEFCLSLPLHMPPEIDKITLEFLDRDENSLGTWVLTDLPQRHRVEFHHEPSEIVTFATSIDSGHKQIQGKVLVVGAKCGENQLLQNIKLTLPYGTDNSPNGAAFAASTGSYLLVPLWSPFIDLHQEVLLSANLVTVGKIPHVIDCGEIILEKTKRGLTVAAEGKLIKQDGMVIKVCHPHSRSWSGARIRVEVRKDRDRSQFFFDGGGKAVEIHLENHSDSNRVLPLQLSGYFMGDTQGSTPIRQIISVQRGITHPDFKLAELEPYPDVIVRGLTGGISMQS